ncbi:MAG: mechanosensitive ion channel domain-containing protein [Candidatus Odinarchaeota archaeon]
MAEKTTTNRVNAQEERSIKPKMKIRASRFEIVLVFFVLIILFVKLTLTVGFFTDLKTYVDDLYEPGTFDMIVQFFDTFIFALTVVIIITLIILRIWRRILKLLEPRTSPSFIGTLNALGRMIIISFAAVAYLNSFPAFSGFFIGFAAIFGTAIGFASTTSVSNLISGLYLMLMRPFLIGDYIIVPKMNAEGVVREMSINYTRIKMPNGTRALIANSDLINQSIVNTRIFRKITSSDGRERTVRYYRYPQNWGIKNEWSHKAAVQAITLTGKEFEDKLIEPVTWGVIKQDQFVRIYEIKLMVEDSNVLLDLTTDFLTRLSETFEEIRLKT